MPGPFARRTFLQSGALSALGLATGATTTRSADRQLSSAASAAVASDGDEPATTRVPADPFITTRGGRFEPADQWIPGALEVHPDVLSIPGRGGLAFATAASIPATTGSFTHIDLIERENDPLYERLRRREGWTYPDGSPVQDASGIVGRTFDGSLHARQSEVAWRAMPSIFAEPTFEYVTTKAARRFERGYSGVLFGNARLTREFGLDFSIWARHAFREHLANLPAERLSALDIDDPESFEVRPTLEARGLTPSTDRNPASDPVFREYLRHHHLGIKSFFDRIGRWLEAAYPDLDPPLHANQPIGDPTLANAAVVETYLSDVVDFVHAEDWRTMPTESIYYPGGGQRPAEDIRDFVPKLLDAAGRRQKTVHVVDGFGGSYYAGFEPGRRYPMLLRLQAAEAYAMGARRDLALTAGGPLHWLDSDGSLSAPLRTFVDFAWANQRFLAGTRPDNGVAVVWSLPTLLWHNAPQWYRAASDHARSFHGTVTLLREARQPYDVVVFGHPDLWQDGEGLERLPSYEAVVLPDVECLTRPQISALEAHLDAGGCLVSSGSWPERTGEYEPLEGDPAAYEHENTVELSGDPGRRRRESGESSGTLVEALRDRGIVSAAPAADRTLGVNRLAQPARDRRIVHLLNYDYDPGTDGFEAKTDVALQLANIDASSDVARFYSPQAIHDLSVVFRDGQASITVPELVDWGFVVLAPSIDHLASDESEGAARSAVQRAGDAIEQLKASTDDWSVDLALAVAAHGEAQTALEHGAYLLAIRASQRALNRADERLSPSPIEPESPTASTAPTGDEPEPTDERTTSGDARGFGLLPAVIGLLGGLGLWRWRQSERE